LPPETDTGTIALERAQGEIEMTDVSFRYNVEHPYALRDINLNIRQNEIIALVGGSGGGKTTLVSLLPRLYDQFDGKITLDGQAIRVIKLEDLRNQFAMVSQNVTLFNDTIARNIAYGEKDIDQARLEQAAEAAHVFDFTNKWSKGLETLVGDDGVLLSGGQRQRVAIARAIYKNAPILIMDEATSALDSISEKQIQEALDRLMQNRTTIIIAHRLSTIEKADKIVVLEQGKIIEVGQHRALLEQKGVYANLYNIQFKNELNTVA